MWCCPAFPTLLAKEAAFSPLYILAFLDSALIKLSVLASSGKLLDVQLQKERPGEVV